ncbi:hypothetical protein EB73_02435 [Mycobacterium sp. SWH-M3]|nr:hypothetical protein EB73_02435 [Mycobacterium sp. SWH-M3]
MTDSILLSPTSIYSLLRWHDEQQIPESVRVLNVAAGSGDAIRAYLRWNGADPHHTATLDEVFTCLASTALAALIAIGSLGGDPNTEMTKHITDITQNLNLP